MLHWYAVKTRSNFEKRVSVDLAAKGIETYLPSWTEVHRWKDRQKLVEMPLFPGYLFARFADCSVTRIEIDKTVGVASILGFGGTIEAVPDSELEDVRSVLSSSARYTVHPLLKEGCWVRVKGGPLREMEGQLVRFKAGPRLVISVGLLGKSVAVEVDTQDVEVICRSERRVA
jgi:transcription termination/antitermination protein NusG